MEGRPELEKMPWVRGSKGTDSGKRTRTRTGAQDAASPPAQRSPGGTGTDGCSTGFQHYPFFLLAEDELFSGTLQKRLIYIIC